MEFSNLEKRTIERLFAGVRPVEMRSSRTHLASIYRKLGIDTSERAPFEPVIRAIYLLHPMRHILGLHCDCEET